MKRKMIVLGLAGAMLIGIGAIPGYAGQQATPQQPAADPATTQQQATTSDKQTFVGVLTRSTQDRSSPKYLVYDQTRKANFYVDGDWKANKLTGHKVKITGTLDEKSGTIHATSIEKIS